MAGMSTNIGYLQAYLKTWDKYRDIWEIKKDPFILRYQRLNTSVSSFEADINRHCTIFHRPPDSFHLNNKACGRINALYFIGPSPGTQRRSATWSWRTR